MTVIKSGLVAWAVYPSTSPVRDLGVSCVRCFGRRARAPTILCCVGRLLSIAWMTEYAAWGADDCGCRSGGSGVVGFPLRLSRRRHQLLGAVSKLACVADVSYFFVINRTTLFFLINIAGNFFLSRFK